MSLRPLFALAHGLLWLAGVAVLLVGLALCVAAYGLPGAWFQGALDAAIPADWGRLTVGRVAWRPGAGLVLERVAFRAPDGRLLGGFARGAFGLRLRGGGPWAERLTAAEIDGLHVAQIAYGPEEEGGDGEGGEPFPDLSGVPVPTLRGVRLRLADPDIVEIRARTLTGTLDAGDGALRFRNLVADVDGSGDQRVEADVTIDIHDAKASASIRGFLIQTRLDGLWRAINCPVIGRYCDHFALAGPAWGDCAFTVGFDLARDLLDLRLDLVSTEGGTYRGIPFDEAQTTIRCRSIWDTVAEIGPVVIRRGGKVAATADLRLDYPADRLSFRARATGLTPAECLGIIDGELAADLPSILCTDFPSVTVAGHIPLSGDETLPSQVVLEGEASAPGGALIEGLPTASASARFAMTNGVFALRDVALALPHGGAVSGALAFDIPDRAPHAELSAALRLREASLADLLAPLGSETLTNCFATGFVDLRGRLGPDFPSTLQAEYDLTVDGGLIRRLPLFAGLTDLLAEHVPGVSAVTDSSTARLVGTADHGIFAIPDFSLDGDLLAIEGPATYDLPNDALSAEVIAGNFRRGTLMGTLTRWVTVPVNRFLWRVKVAGPLAAPTWSLSTVLGRWWEKALGGDSAPSDGE